MTVIEREYEVITNNLHRVLIADSAGKGAGDKSAGDLLTVMPDLLQSALKRVQVRHVLSLGRRLGVVKTVFRWLQPLWRVVIGVRPDAGGRKRELSTPVFGAMLN
jgi:hypothetical protein